MQWTYPLFYLAIFCAGVSLDIILESDTQTLTVLAGETTTFHCHVTGADVKNYQMIWYKKHEDNSLTLVYRPSNNSNDHLRSNIKGKIDVLNSQYILDIQETTTKDVGTYYCGSVIHSAALLLLTTSEPTGSDWGGRSN
nr:T cell receptor delta variable 2 [Pipistrellus kuhlii]